MHSACPDLETLDRHAADPSRTDRSVHAHLSSCGYCIERLSEIERNRAFFDDLGAISAELAGQLPNPVALPMEIGGCEIIREIGRGGMGVVYEARQSHPVRRVALKVLRREFVSSTERIRLFEREIQALARLRHPGITAIFESGASSEGPFYVMEFIEGTPLSEFGPRTALSIPERLRLFLRICAAISYAHQHGVIHRDLKPGNILIEADATPKILDFGLARIVDVEIAGGSLAMDTGRIVGTLAYMSPEQTTGRSEEIDVRSDVYSLGVILYELLTGKLPYDVPRHAVPLAVQSICESAPAPPSKFANKVTAKTLAGDLDTIVLTAIEKQPERRYQSVAAFAEDISRFLNRQPIVARPPSTLYQLRKFAQRNRGLVTASLLILLAMVAGLITTAWQSRRARMAEKVALAEAATNAEINRFLTRMFSAVDPAIGGPSVKVVDILKAASDEIEGQFKDQPRVEMELRAAIGRAYQSLTLYKESEPQFRASVTLAGLILGPDARDTLSYQYHLGLARAHADQLQAAYDDLTKTAATQGRVFGPDDPDTLLTRDFLAVLETELGRLEAAEVQFRDTWERRRRVLGREHKKTLESQSNLGLLLCRLGELEESDRLTRETHEIALRVYGPDDPQTIMYAGYVAMIARTPAELEAVEPIYREIVQRATRVYGPEHQLTLSFLDSLALLLELRCKYAEAEAVARDVFDRMSRAFGEADARTVGAMVRIEHLLTLQEKYGPAEDLCRRVLAISTAQHGEFSVQACDALYELIHPLHGAGKLEEALELAQKTTALRIALDGESSLGAALCRTLMSEILLKLGRVDEACAAAETSLSTLHQTAGAQPVLVGWAESNVGSCRVKQRQFDEAERYLLQGRDKLVAGLGDCHPICAAVAAQIEELDKLKEAHQELAGQGLLAP